MNTSYTYQDGLQTERLLTRLLTCDDIPLWADFFKDKEAVEFLSIFGDVTYEDLSKHWIERQLKRYEEHRYGLQALMSKETGAYIGQAGLIAQKVDGIMEMEIGYHIFRKYWGQGFAPEAAKCFVDYAFNNNLALSIISIIDIGNKKSQRVAEKSGLIKERQTKWAHHDVYIYRINKESWKNNLFNSLSETETPL